MSEPKGNSLDIVLNGYHAKGHTAQVAHQKLVKLAGDISYTLAEVEALYTKMDQEMQGGKLKVECITDFPKHLNRKIVEGLDVPGREALRKTCHLYRDFVKDVRLHIEKLKIEFRNEYVKVIGDGGFAVTYRKIREEPKNHMMESEKSNQKLEGHFFNVAMINLKSILMNKNLRIDELCVNEFIFVDGYFGKFLDILNSREEKLKVETLIANMDDLEEGNSFYRLLQSLDIGTIKTIIMAPSDMVLSNLNHDVYELQQWKSIKRLEVYDLILDAVGFTNISHLETCYLSHRYKSIKAELMMLLKDKLLLNPSLNQVKIELGSWARGNIGKLLEAIQPFKYSATSLWAYFDYPNSKEKLALSVTEDHIWFKGPRFVEEEAPWE